MLEILLLINLCRRIGEAARAKGRAAGGYQLMLVAFWFGGEVGTALAGGIVMALLFGEQEEGGVFCFLYILAIVGAALGAVIAFQIVANLPDAGAPDDLDRWRDDDRGAGSDADDR
jgi:uncharacterized YccA/Bax inhibitor family protein